MSQLPQGWVFSKLGEIVDIISGVGFPKHAQGRITGDFPFAKVSDISRAVLSNQNVLEDATNYIEEGDLKSLHAKLIPPGSTVFAKIGEALRLNRRAITKRTLVIDNNCMALTPNAKRVVPEYLFRFMMTVDLSPLAVATAIPSVRRDDIAQLDIPLPPTIEEQRRIVARLDTLLAQSKAARAELNKALALAKRQRQAVLAKAFSGELTKDWRKIYKDLKPIHISSKVIKGKSNEVKDFAYSRLMDVPSTWNWYPLSFLGTLERGKSKHRPRNDAILFGGKYPFIQTGDIRSANRYVRSYIQTYNDIGLAQSKLWPEGTLCITIAANIAETAILGIEACFPDSIVGFIADPSVCDSVYIDFFIRTVKEDLAAFAPATAQKNINLDTLNNLLIPLPSLEEQKEIVKRIEAAFAQIETMENEAKKALALAERLEQATLAKAFQGQL